MSGGNERGPGVTRIGTSGFRGAPAAHFETFDLVELGWPLGRMPSLTEAQRWRAEAPVPRGTAREADEHHQQEADEPSARCGDGEGHGVEVEYVVGFEDFEVCDGARGEVEGW